MQEDVNTGEWNHYCFQLSVPGRRFTIVHNGYTERNHTQPELWSTVDNHVSSEWFGPLDRDRDPWTGMIITLSGDRSYFQQYLK